MRAKSAAIALGLMLLAPFCASAHQMSSEQVFGYKTYLSLHPPKDKAVKYNLYPNPGPVIAYGDDIPLCAAAREKETYARKTEMRFLHHGKNGWLFRDADFRTDFKATPETMDYFKRLNSLLAGKGQRLIVAFQPPRGMMEQQYIDPADRPAGYTPEKAREGYRAFLAQLHDADIVAPDLSNVAAGTNYFPKGDFHWTPEGARDSASKIALSIRDLSSYDDMPQGKFNYVISGYGPADRGAFEEFIQSTCKENIELTSEPFWQSTSEAAGAADLLGDAAAPAITLLGTSNSSEEQKFNFAGFLRHDLGTDIYNAAILGGGFGSSAFRYFASDEYRKQPPKVILWEFLSQHNYNNAESQASLRQMIPAVHGACEASSALAVSSGTITAPKSDIFKKLPNGASGKSYLYLDLSDPAERELKLEILYGDGNADQVELTRSTRAANNGRYFFELAHPTERILSAKMVTTPPRGKYEARLCAYPESIAGK